MAPSEAVVVASASWGTASVVTARGSSAVAADLILVLAFAVALAVVIGGGFDFPWHHTP
jgi:hypothetical protein